MKKFSSVVVSNRLPVSVSKQNGELHFETSSGGLATALSSLDVDDMIWVGWPGIASDDLTKDEIKRITNELRKRDCIPVFLSAEQVRLFYEGYANDTLWPLFHYFQNLTVYKDTYWQTYRAVNRLFMSAAKKVASPAATIWVQDYQLMLLPALIRQALPATSIGFFLHIPFPSYEIFRLLPQRREVLEGLLGSDLIGFHVYDYARHFLSSCLRLLGISNEHGIMQYEGRVIRADAFPISIDYEKFTSMRGNPEVVSARQAIAEAQESEFTILSIDRLDYSKGIIQRLDAYKLFLENNPKYLGRIKLVMVAVPSRTEVETYQQLRDDIEQLVSRINGMFSTTEWTPISYQFQNLPFHEICALYSHADIMLVTPIRDGMNLVAKEYVASKSLADPGVLILSEMTGAVDELPESLVVNPNDIHSIERAITRALTMSKKEKSQRLQKMQQRLSDYPVKAWCEDFLSELEHTKAQQNTQARLDFTLSDQRAMIAAHHQAKQRLLVFDYDGTLQSFKPTPDANAAKPSKQLRDTLRSLAADSHTTVCIVSGRKKDMLDEWFAGTQIVLVAEHGAWRKQDGVWKQYADDYEPIRDAVDPIMRDYVSRTPGSLIEQKDFASVWHYRNVPVELSYVRASNLYHELQTTLTDTKATVHRGSKIIEVKPEGIDKGSVLRTLLEQYQPDFILVAGDDYTDEDMFTVTPVDGYSIRVGAGETTARYRIKNVAAMVALISMLATPSR